MNTVYLPDTVEFLDAQPIENNPTITKVKIKVAEAGPNRNKYILPKEVLDEAAKNSLGLTPIVAFYNYYKEDFGQHGAQAVLDERGFYQYTADTKAIGVVPENPEIFWEDNYLTTYGYLWTSRYEEGFEALQGKGQSMELDPNFTIMEAAPNGYTLISQTAFSSLCILGDDVPPAFSKASIEGVSFSLKEDTEQIDKEVKELLDAIKFSLYNEGKPNLIADIDGEERDKKNREKITKAIDALDSVAENIVEEDTRNTVDDAITSLVDAEIDMKREADIIIADEDTEKALQGTVAGNGDIVSNDGQNFSKASNSILKKNPKEEESTVAKKEEEKEVEVKQEVPEQLKDTKEVEQEEVKEEVPAQEEDKKEEVAPSDETAPEATQAEPGAETPADEEGAAFEEAEGTGEEVPGAAQGETADTIAAERKTAEDKRASKLLSNIGNSELFAYLMERVDKSEQIMQSISQYLQSEMPEGLPQPDDSVQVDPGEVVQSESKEDVGIKETESIESAPEPEMEVEQKDGLDKEAIGAASDKPQGPAGDPEGAPGVEGKVDSPSEEGEEKSPAESDGEGETPEATKEEKPAEKEEEDKKKKPAFALEDVKNIVAENLQLTKEVESLKAQNKELLGFRLQVENEQKESTLLEFALSEKAQNEIRADFDNMTIEEVEARAAITMHRETKATRGQNSGASQIEFSLQEEEQEPSFNADDEALVELLKQAKALTSGL